MDARDMDQILVDLATTGWSVVQGSPESAARVIEHREMWQMMSNGPGARRQSSILQPMTRAEAPVRSLSAVYGLNAQPLHSDGAHLTEPPDVILLACSGTSPTGTVVWTPELGQVPDYVRTGMFTVHGNQGRFLASAYDGGFRFDPVAMHPSDHYARAAMEYFATRRNAAHTHQWSEPDTLLFINNRKCLHARNAVEGDAATRRVTRYAYRTQASS